MKNINKNYENLCCHEKYNQQSGIDFCSLCGVIVYKNVTFKR